MKIYLQKGKSRNVSSEELLRKALKAYSIEYKLDASIQGIETREIQRTGKGKPFIKNFPLEFSISHSGNIWVCAIGKCTVGIDIQIAKPGKTIEVAKRFFTKEEADFIWDNDSKAFFQIWSRKEAFVKYTGEGISYGFDNFSVIVDGELTDELELPVKCHFENIQLMDGYECCVCTKKKQKIEISDL